MTEWVSLFTEWITKNGIDIFGVVFMLWFLYLEIRQKWTMWIVGIISSAVFIYINLDKHLYAMVGLMIYQVIVSVYGLYCWKFAKTKENQNLPITFISKKLAFQLTLISVPVFVLLAFIFSKNPDNTLFFNALDAFIATFSVVASWMAARKIIESWYLWMIVNPCNIAIYIYKDSLSICLLYFIYAAFSIVGYLQWKKVAIKQP
ncbi:nicotinamide mononucleotide transporter [Bacteroidia bacterium]|nr:nicotinamide mononucleotide transporter [Bacteroidia bacterium]GHT89030.1 nicotinamide mononucleotide transporter [Bacteroidia bacterium]